MNAALFTSYPSTEDAAATFFREAVRHYDDTIVLHTKARYAAAIASSTKSVELAVKATVILVGGLGWWDKLFITHAPLKDIKTHGVLAEAIRTPLDKAMPGLIARIESLEDLSPNKAGAFNYVPEREANPEYPFLGKSTTSTVESGVAFYTPSEFFDSIRSQDAIQTAYDTLVTISRLSDVFRPSVDRLQAPPLT